MLTIIIMTLIPVIFYIIVPTSQDTGDKKKYVISKKITPKEVFPWHAGRRKTFGIFIILVLFRMLNLIECRIKRGPTFLDIV